MTMGTQFRLATDEHDEQLLWEHLGGRWRTLCAPRFLATPELCAVPVGQCSSREQIVFPLELLDLVQARVVPVLGREGEYHVHPKAGACLEWTRAEVRSGNVVIPGRVYLDSVPDEGAEAKVLNAMMKNLKTFVQREYPFASKDKVPILVGRSLSERILKGEAQVLYPGGSPVPLEAVKK